MSCELMDSCLFFNRTHAGLHPHSIAALKEVYCTGDHLLCARRQVAKAVGGEHVPQHLTPDRIHLVRDIIEDVLSKQ